MTPKKLYRPSNGTEGMIFVENYCSNCIHEKFMHTQDHADKKCDIFSRTLLHKIDDPEYPKEWVYDEEGWGCCTKYQHWDWWGGPWGNDFKDPPPEPINDPNQLCMNFYLPDVVEELEYEHG